MSDGCRERRQDAYAADEPSDVGAGASGDADQPGTIGRGDDEEETSMARRRILKLAAYVGPIVVGTFFARDADAGSCGPNSTCVPTTKPPKPPKP